MFEAKKESEWTEGSKKYGEVTDATCQGIAAVGVGVCVIDPHAPAWHHRTYPCLSLDNITMEMTGAPPSKHLASANH